VPGMEVFVALLIVSLCAFAAYCLFLFVDAGGDQWNERAVRRVPGAPATARATARARVASAPGTSARAPPPHPTAIGSTPPRARSVRPLPW
jgi:hypothetical protein